MHFQYNIKNNFKSYVYNHEADRIAGFLNTNGYLARSTIRAVYPKIDLTPTIISNKPISSYHLKELEKMGIKLEQITEEEYKEAFKKR